MSRIDVCARRLRNTWAILLLLLSILAGCAKAMPSDEPVTIKFAYFGPAEDYEPVIQEFNEDYPHITVELDTSDEDNADVSIISPFDLSEPVEESAILSLDPFIEQDESLDLSDFYPGTIELFTAEGRTWADPGGVDVLVTFYNRDLFDQHNLPYPDVGWTWNDLLRSAVEIRDPDAGMYGYVTRGRTNEASYFDAALFVYLHGGRLFNSIQAPTGTTFDW